MLVAVSLKAVHSTSGPKIIFPSFFVSEKGLAHIYKKNNLLFSSFFRFALQQAKISVWPN